MEDSETSASLSRLLCQEDEDSLHEEFDMTNDSNYSNFNSDAITESDEEYIESLVRSETSFEKTSVLSDDCPRMSKSWLKCARLDAIKWILDARTYFGFHYRTAYLSVVYFDRFLSRRQVGNERFWVVRLLSVACLSLAAKMEEHRVPSLSDFPIEDFDFENKVIQRMELLVLNTLEWRMNTTTPFAYLGYFMLKFLGGDKTDELFSRAAELILAITKGNLNTFKLFSFEPPILNLQIELFVEYRDYPDGSSTIYCGCGSCVSSIRCPIISKDSGVQD